MPKVSAVVTSFNGQHLLQKNLPAVLLALRDSDELMIVDDTSQDATVEWLCQGFRLNELSQPGSTDSLGKFQIFRGNYQSGNKKTTVTLIANQQNLRFAKSCNRAARLATNPLLWLLNNDVAPDKNCLDNLCLHFGDQENIGNNVFAVGALEYEGNDTQAPMAGKNRLWFEHGLFMHSKAQDFASGPTAWASGGSALFDRAKWLELDGFDTQYHPAYWEDVDLSFRARAKGWQVLFESQAVVFHKHESTNKSVFGEEKIKTLSLKHQRYFTLKHSTLWQKIQYYLWRPYWWRMGNV